MNAREPKMLIDLNTHDNRMLLLLLKCAIHLFFRIMRSEYYVIHA